ncbi:hypothetical protein BH23ACT7_BH23ACT7_26540 [soil metagenome]
MTATTPAPTPSVNADVRPPRPVVSHPIARLGAPIALLIGSIMAVVGQGLHIPAMAEDVGIVIAIAEAPSAWMASHLLLGFGFALVAMGVAATLPRRRGRGAGLTAAGVIIVSLGAAVMALGDIAHGALGFALIEPVDAATSFEVQKAYYEGPMAPGLNLGTMLLPLGMILAGVGLLRSRLHARWVGIVIALSPFAVQASFALDLPTYLHLIPFAIGMSVYAMAVVRGPQDAHGGGAAAAA